MALAAAWVLLCTPNFSITFWTWKFTVRSEMLRMPPISHAVLPTAVQRRIST